MRKLLLTLAVATFVVSCTKEQTDHRTHEQAAPTLDVGTTTTTTDGTTTAAVPGQQVSLEISGDDAMRFDKSELRVPAGSKVTLTLRHTGTLAKEAMGHNWVLLKQGTSINDFGMAAVNAKDNGYIPAGSTDYIAHTDMIGGGESTSVTFDAPAPGTYDFICSFPGHFSAMQGKFIVE
ncbi:MAG: azurin [Weeksellaceae bacterium]|nr:azurin [Weeksellaceae bacterium]